jgi:hypothetical protein
MLSSRTEKNLYQFLMGWCAWIGIHVTSESWTGATGNQNTCVGTSGSKGISRANCWQQLHSWQNDEAFGIRAVRLKRLQGATGKSEMVSESEASY